MKYLLEIAEDKNLFAEEVFKSMSFIKNIRVVEENKMKEAKPDTMNIQEIKNLQNEYQLASIENEELQQEFADVDSENWENE
jgi:ABC-type lipopolysaccharide export system ATPase subunit